MRPAAAPPSVVIVGAGFGGLWAARALSRLPVRVLLIDRRNYHTFLPLLYQVAAAEIEPEEIVCPVRSILRRSPRAEFLLAEVGHVDLGLRTVNAAGREIAYDYLVLSCGSITEYFGVPGAAEHAFPLKTLEDGITLRNHILHCFERAAREADSERRKALMTFVVIGGGATGVEFAGALAELVRRPLREDYRALDFREVRVLLLEAADSLLRGMPERLSAYARARLVSMGVDVRCSSPVHKVDRCSVHFGDGSSIATETTVWTAGVRGDASSVSSALRTSSGGRVQVLPTLQLEQHPEVYVIGDLAVPAKEGRPLPMVAPVAIQQGEAAGRNIARQISGAPVVPFKFRDHGMMVTLGRNAAVFSAGGVELRGFIAWVGWLAVHIVKLIGFRNRLFVMVNWAWDYLFFERTVRLILPGPVTPAHPEGEERARRQ